MTRAEVLKWRKLMLPDATVSVPAVGNIIDCYESLLSRCVPWLEWLRQSGLKRYTENKKQLDALLKELEPEGSDER